MAIKRIAQSHIDHGLTDAQVAYALSMDAPSGAVHVQTVELPIALGTAPCGLSGPAAGGNPVEERDVYYAARGSRPGLSRLVQGDPQPSRLLTVISGPEGQDGCVLYTAFGGPAAPREVWELDNEETRSFWAEHALIDNELAPRGGRVDALLHTVAECRSGRFETPSNRDQIEYNGELWKDQCEAEAELHHLGIEMQP